jgi:hypothetical protein
VNETFAADATVSGKCVPSNHSEEFRKSVAGGDLTKQAVWSDFKSVHVIYGRPSCNVPFYYPNPRKYKSANYTLLENGTLMHGMKLITNYCVDYVENEHTVLPLVCIDDASFSDFLVKLDRHLKLIGWSSSVICLTLTFLAYAIVPSLRNLHGLNLLSHILSLIITYTSLLVVANFLKVPKEIYVIVGRFLYLLYEDLKIFRRISSFFNFIQLYFPV